jgi:multidrug efflux pump subunit AcrA (membrane-fusion protein)
MYAQVSLAMNTHPNAMTLPAAAVGADSDGHFVYTVRDNRITRVAIKIGVADNGNIEVIEGLADDTPVVAAIKGAPPPGTLVQPSMAHGNS